MSALQFKPSYLPVGQALIRFLPKAHPVGSPIYVARFPAAPFPLAVRIGFGRQNARPTTYKSSA
jgi:hypothetical protein